MRIRSCLEVSHEFARIHPESLAIALVCMKIPLRPKKFAFHRFNYEKKVTSGVVNMRIRSCLEVSHEFARIHPESLAIALVCMKIPLRPKKFAFRRFNYEKKVTSGVVNMRIRSCLEVSHEFARIHPESLAIALVCMKIPLRPKKFAFRRFNYEKKVTSGVQKKF